MMVIMDYIKQLAKDDKDPSNQFLIQQKSNIKK